MKQRFPNNFAGWSRFALEIEALNFSVFKFVVHPFVFICSFAALSVFVNACVITKTCDLKKVDDNGQGECFL